MKLLFAFIFISSLTFAQDFEDKYDISGFLNKTHSIENNRKKFKEFFQSSCSVVDLIVSFFRSYLLVE